MGRFYSCEGWAGISDGVGDLFWSGANELGFGRRCNAMQWNWNWDYFVGIGIEIEGEESWVREIQK